MSQLEACKEILTANMGIPSGVIALLDKLDIHTARDLLLYLPVRYQNRVDRVAVSNLEPGVEALVSGTIANTYYVGRSRRIFVCRLEDETGQLHVPFFHFYPGQAARFEKGGSLTCFGRVRESTRSGELEMAQPEYRLQADYSWTKGKPVLTPVYRGVRSRDQTGLRSAISKALRILGEEDEDSTDSLFSAKELPGLASALHIIHLPPLEDQAGLSGSLKKAYQRLDWEQILARMLVGLQLKDARMVGKARRVEPKREVVDAFLARLPFQPTGAQHREIDSLLKELARPYPMRRLLQGDVGSGKTLVATAGLLAAVESGAQAALMVPTEILAQQHLNTLQQWSLPAKVLTGRTTARQRRSLLKQLADGEPCIVVGTHALFQQDVQFADLALVVIDEQHKFGVHQRLALWEKGEQPHQLIMTATPIPRTLAINIYSELEIGVLDEIPAGRSPVTTVAMSKRRSLEVMERIGRACRQGQQAYWICPFIEISEEIEEVAAAETVESELREHQPSLRVGLLHGRLAGAKKEALMNDFCCGELDVLVATTVVEVGVDVPNATIMVIDSSERLGLAQLHQLRGRVGRSEKPGYCILLYAPPLSENARKRLAVMRNTTDGFAIAEQDLRLRGAGELLGSQQTGRADMRLIESLMAEASNLPYLQKLALKNRRQPVARTLIDRWLPESTRLGQQA